MPFYDNGTDENRRNFSIALESILRQEFRDFEVVVVVSGEKKFAREIARKSAKIRLFEFDQKVVSTRRLPLSEKLFGIITARNISLEKARGKYVAYADFDDVSEPGRLGKQVRFLKEHPEIGAVGTAMTMIDGQGNIIGVRSAPETDSGIRKKLLQFNPMPQPSLMAQASLVRKAGGYRKDGIPEDYDLWVRMAKLTKFHNLQEPLVRYRVHPGGGASNYKFELFFGALRVKRRAMRLLGLHVGPADVAVNLLQFASLFFPTTMRRVAFEKIRSKLVIGK